MKLTHYIARRFALGGKGAGTSRFTGWIAILGMGVGCFALVLSVSILQGFETQVIQKIRGFESDIRIHGTVSSNEIRTINDIEGIKMTSEFMERKGLIKRRGNSIRLITLKAIDLHMLDRFYSIGLDIDNSSSDDNSVYIGKTLATRLNARAGDTVTLINPIDAPGLFGIPSMMQCTVKGVFSADVLQFDDEMVFISLESGKQLYKRNPDQDGLDLRLVDPKESDIVKSKILKHGLGNKIETWDEMHEALYNAMRMERIGAMIILSLIIIVAAFNLSTTLVLITTQKISELGMLRAMGANRRMIQRIILRQGFLIGGSGAGIGFFLGVSLVWIQESYSLIKLPTNIYLHPVLPVELTFSSSIAIIFIAGLFIYLASQIAAKRLETIEPSHSLFTEK